MVVEINVQNVEVVEVVMKKKSWTSRYNRSTCKKRSSKNSSSKTNGSKISSGKKSGGKKSSRTKRSSKNGSRN